MTEPRLSAEDRRIWETWMRTAAIRARHPQFLQRVDQAKRVVERALEAAPRSCLMWSGGKDSTVMVHLACVELGARIPVGSEKDDLDYPGEREYVEQLAAGWGLDLHVLVPPVSPQKWLAEHAHEIQSDDDVHSRAAALSKACFYDVVEAWSAPYDGVLLGFRQAESNGRRLNRASRGTVYEVAPTKWRPAPQGRAQPIVDFEDVDVYAYAVSRGIELLPVYRCVALMHRHNPARIRKSWWLPGVHARNGGIAWLRYYYPSLFRRLCELLPDARLHA